MKRFLSGDEAFAEGVRLARPQVISAYPITPQTVVVERLSEMVEDGSLAAEYVHVESEHSALSCAIGASATGARTFTATSSQGLLYMAECLTYAAGGRFPIVMMNANRATALPWNIYGDQRDSLALLDHGWIQVYAEDNQEALDLALMAYAVAENPAVATPVMVNLDGFALTHTYETVDVPTPEQADAVCAAIRATLADLYGAEVAEGMRVLYGGSMNPKNAAELLAQPDIDGGLIGGAALKPEQFVDIINAANQE